MKKRILIRFGDMMLKGQNIGYFIKRIRQHMLYKLSDLSVSYVLRHDRVMIDYQEDDENTIVERLKMIPGIYDFSIAYVCEPNMESIIKTAIHTLNHEIDRDGVTFKIETKRTDKKFPITSLDFSKTVAKPILDGTQWKMVVDVKHPKSVLHIDIRIEGAYLYLKEIKGMGGYPFGTGGKALLMMSGGIDSPVAGLLSIKQGIEVELIHFESTPLTPIESVQKVIDLSKVLSKYCLNGKIKLHIVPFMKLHHAILENVYEPYMITVMRRMMYRIAERFTYKKDIHALINGESVGQVASQTLQSLKVVEGVTKIPILRPLITYDKLDIIRISKTIKTYDISIRPFNDCCSIYVPKQPVTKPMEVYAAKYENTFDYEIMIKEAIQNIITLVIDEKKPIDISNYGFTFSEAISNYNKEMSDVVDHIETE